VLGLDGGKFENPSICTERADAVEMASWVKVRDGVERGVIPPRKRPRRRVDGIPRCCQSFGMRRTQIQLPDDTFARAKELGMVRKISFANFEALSADEAVRDPLVLEFLNLRRHFRRPLRTRHA
jgi:hypothetical protein